MCRPTVTEDDPQPFGERRERGWGAGRARVFEDHSFGLPRPPTVRTFVGLGPLGHQPGRGLVSTPVYLLNTSRRNECAPGLQPLRLGQPAARVLEPLFLLLLAAGDRPASCAVRESARFFARLLQSLESEAGAKIEGPLLARRGFRAWEGTVRRQESWLTGQVPAWTRVRALRAPARRHRAEAVVAVRRRCSGTSRSSLPTSGARAGSSRLRAPSAGILPQHPPVA